LHGKDTVVYTLLQKLDFLVLTQPNEGGREWADSLTNGVDMHTRLKHMHATIHRSIGLGSPRSGLQLRSQQNIPLCF
jgi:hypothetical protein